MNRKPIDTAVSLVVSYRRDPEGNRVDEGDAWVIASVDGMSIGGLRWNYLMEPPTVLDVTVDPAWRGRGIATAMWDIARQRESALAHSDSLTADGAAWVGSLSEGGAR